MTGRSHRGVDVALATLLALQFGALSFHRSAQLPDLVYHFQAGDVSTTDLWFDGDLPRHACTTIDRLSREHRFASEHPLLSTLMHAPAHVVRLFGVQAPEVIRVVVAGHAGLWLALFYGLLRLMTLKRIDALIFSALAAATAAAVFWTVVPESFVLGSMSMLLPAIWLARSVGRVSCRACEVVVSAASLAVTLTNWSSGILASLALRRPFSAALQASANAMVLVAALGVAQWAVFPSAAVFPGEGRAFQNVADPHFADPVSVVRTFFFHAVVLPTPALIGDPRGTGPLTVQAKALPLTSLSGGVAVALWIGLLATGIAALMRGAVAASLRFWLVALLLQQLALHLVFGDETFLFSMHFTPLLVLVAAAGSLGRFRAMVLTAAVAGGIVMFDHNGRQFDEAVAHLNRIAAVAPVEGPIECEH